MPEIISFVKKEANKKPPRITKSRPEDAFSLCQDPNLREYQEDAVAWKTYPPDYFNECTPLHLGMRLWSTYKLLNQKILSRINERKIGSTACTTLYDGDKFLVTASIADSCSFAVFYDEQDTPIKVIRLNKYLHKADDVFEQERIKAAEGKVSYDVHWRVQGILIVSRALGDFYCKGICSDARIDILNVHEEKNHLIKNKTPAKRIQVITVSDGFTDGAHSDREKDMEDFVLRCLQERKGLAESELTVSLVKAVKEIKLFDNHGFLIPKVRDNISIAIQTLKPGMPFMIGVFDGHGGGEVARFCARNLFAAFDESLSLNPLNLNDSSLSPFQMQNEFVRDHKHLLQGKFKEEWIKYLALNEIVHQTALCFDSFKSQLGRKNTIFKGLVKTIKKDMNESAVEIRINSILSYLDKHFSKEQSNFDFLKEHKSPKAQDFCNLIEHHLKELHGFIKMDEFGFIRKWFNLTDFIKYEDYTDFLVNSDSTSNADEEKKSSTSGHEFFSKQALEKENPLTESDQSNNTNRF
ncbi:MAG: hypothetical protein BGO90_10975 [Legionella sp. 40-6]|nr:hypothetical protein [Legionella sp.]OJY48743.1 MAG: hypothetical protein BGO90_10975 [Legionella sp. 40-6]